MTDWEACSPSESVTVRVIRYRVFPLKSWPLAGMVKLPALTPVCGSARVHVALVQEVDAPGEGAGSQDAVVRVGGVAAEEDRVPARNSAPLSGARMVGTGRLPTLIVIGVESVVLLPSDTVSRAA